MKTIEQEWQGFSAMIFRNVEPTETQVTLAGESRVLPETDSRVFADELALLWAANVGV